MSQKNSTAAEINTLHMKYEAESNIADTTISVNPSATGPPPGPISGN